MKKFFTISLILMAFNFVIAQNCGTEVSEEQIEYIRNFDKSTTRNMSVAQGILDIPLQFHIVRDDKGASAVDLKVLKNKVEQLNEIYIDANLRFIMKSEINFIDLSQHYHFDYYKEEELCAEHDVENAINVYCVKSIRSGFYGYTYHPKKSRKNRMLMSSLGWDNNSTFPHEMGHFFGLYHTHGKGGKIKEASEPIDRNVDLDGNGIIDCYETGDDLCDTPSDPNIGLKKYQNFCKQNCTLSGKIPDENGNFYEPEITNLMSYNQHSDCRTNFTSQQLSRVYQTARKERKEIVVKKLEETKMIAAEVVFQMENQDRMPVKLDVNLYRFENIYQDGDSFTFDIKNLTKEGLYMGIINMDIRNKIVKVYPYQDDLSIIQPKSKMNPLDGLITLDNGRQSGKEYTCLLFSYQPINVDAIVSKMSAVEGTFTQRLYRVLGRQLLPLDHVDYKKGSKISFEAQLEKEELLPIMLEMNQVN